MESDPGRLLGHGRLFAQGRLFGILRYAKISQTHAKPVSIFDHGISRAEYDIIIIILGQFCKKAY